jgi:hypothetical protein
MANRVGTEHTQQLNDTMVAKMGLLPTPMQQDRQATVEGTLKRKEIYGGEKRAMYLANYAVMGMLPTPRACEAIERRNMKTIVDKVENGGDVTLTTLAKYQDGRLLPTPRANDSHHSTDPEQKSFVHRQDRGYMAEVVMDLANAQPGTTSQLNHRFVLEMMGFPPDWTELPFLNCETNPSKQPVTP